MLLNTSSHPPATITARPPLFPAWITGAHPADLPSPIYSFLCGDNNFCKTTSGQDGSLPHPLQLFFNDLGVICSPTSEMA